MITIFDEQTGKLVTGTVEDVTDFTFTLKDQEGTKIGVFDKSVLERLERKAIPEKD